MNFAKRLRELREEKGFSQMTLARETGISQSSIARWELEKAEPTASARLLSLQSILKRALIIYLV